MKGTIKRQLILMLCLAIGSLAVGLGVNFILNQRFDTRIEEEKRKELDAVLEDLMADVKKLTPEERTAEALEALAAPLIEADHGLAVGYLGRESREEIVFRWDPESESVQAWRLPSAFPLEEPARLKDGRDRPQISRERDKIRTLRPVPEGDRITGVLWIEDSIISDIRTFILVRILTGAAVLVSLLVGVFGAFFITRRLIRDIERINRGIARMKEDLGYRIEVTSDELGDVAREMNQMAGQLQAQKRLEERLHQADKMAALGQFVSGIAHELRNPLGIMKGSLQLLEREGDFTGEQKEFFRIAQEQISRQNRIIEELLQFARPSEPTMERIDPESLLDSTLVFSRAYLKDAGIALDRKRSEGIGEIFADAEKLKQVFLNLILNAVQAMPEGGRLTISTERLGDGRLAVRFRDTGEGIPKEALANLFNPYYTTRDEGTGLGLSISYQIVRMLGGSIEAESETGKGSLFTVFLPLAD